MKNQEIEYDVFLSHASEDTDWCEQLAERLRNDGVQVWFDKWQLKPGDHLLKRLNDGLKKSRKMVAIWSQSYFRDDKVWTLAEGYSQQHPDVLAQQRPLIPLVIEGCDIPPTFRNLIYIDFQNKHDFDLRFRQLIEALDLPRKEFVREDVEAEFREHELDRTKIGKLTREKGKRFEDEVAMLYNLLGFDVEKDIRISGFQIDLMIEQKIGGLRTKAIVECKNKRITSDDRDQILAQQNVIQKEFPVFRWIGVDALRELMSEKILKKQY